MPNGPDSSTKALYDAARPPDSSKPDHKSLLLGHVIGTMTAAATVTDASMSIPSTFHSHPDFQKLGPNRAGSAEQPPSGSAGEAMETDAPLMPVTHSASHDDQMAAAMSGHQEAGPRQDGSQGIPAAYGGLWHRRSGGNHRAPGAGPLRKLHHACKSTGSANME